MCGDEFNAEFTPTLEELTPTYLLSKERVSKETL
jgi:hypothetical protein